MLSSGGRKQTKGKQVRKWAKATAQGGNERYAIGRACKSEHRKCAGQERGRADKGNATRLTIGVVKGDGATVRGWRH